MAGIKFTKAKRVRKGRVRCGASITRADFGFSFVARRRAGKISSSNMSDARNLTRIPTLKPSAEFKAHLQSLGIDLPCDDVVQTGTDSPLTRPVGQVKINGKIIGNRIAIHPMEGWDGTTTGGITA